MDGVDLDCPRMPGMPSAGMALTAKNHRTALFLPRARSLVLPSTLFLLSSSLQSSRVLTAAFSSFAVPFPGPPGHVRVLLRSDIQQHLLLSSSSPTICRSSECLRRKACVWSRPLRRQRRLPLPTPVSSKSGWIVCVCSSLSFCYFSLALPAFAREALGMVLLSMGSEKHHPPPPTVHTASCRIVWVGQISLSVLR